MSKKLIIALSGASGAIYGVRMLEVLQQADVETHAVVSKAAAITLKQELGMSVGEVEKLADVSYPVADIGAAISSGSFVTAGMVVAPCSMRSLAEIATGMSTNLLSRAADVTLKEKRRLVLMVRETPLHSVHLQHMLTLSQMGAVMAPPVPAMYTNPGSIDDLVNHSVGRVLDLFDIKSDVVKRWAGTK